MKDHVQNSMAAPRSLGMHPSDSPLHSHIFYSIRPEDAYGQLLDRKILTREDRGVLLHHLLQRAKSRPPGTRVRGLSLSEMISK